jgi:hypothetical protein
MSKPGPGNCAGFFIARTRGTQNHVIWWDEEQESESDVRLRVERMIAQGKAHPDDRFFYVFVGALNTPVVGPVMALFGGRRDSLFVNPFK